MDDDLGICRIDASSGFHRTIKRKEKATGNLRAIGARRLCGRDRVVKKIHKLLIQIDNVMMGSDILYTVSQPVLGQRFCNARIVRSRQKRVCQY